MSGYRYSVCANRSPSAANRMMTLRLRFSNNLSCGFRTCSKEKRYMFKKFFSRYFNSIWIPLAVFIVVFMSGTFLSIFFLRFLKLRFLFTLSYIFNVLAFVGMLAAGIFNLAKKRWLKGIVNFIIPIILLGLFLLMAIWTFSKLMGPDSDNFGKNLVISESLKMEEPKVYRVEGMELACDQEGIAILDVYAQPQMQFQGASIDTNITVLDKLGAAERKLLMRHLATSAKWFLSEENGRLSAYRRFVTQNGRWENTLHGYYSSFDFGENHDNYYQFRIALDVDGFDRRRPVRRDATFLKTMSGERPLKVAKGINPGYDSYLILESKGAAVEIFEESKTEKRLLTRLALSFIKDELEALLSSHEARKNGFDPVLMPPESIKQGKPEIYLVGQLGIYLVYAYINPGEPGYVYLKAFEETRNTPLSSERLRKRSLEYTGWSLDPDEQFFYNTQITIYEGDWGTYYPARFELWFVPESGAPERKLIEKVFKIEGWQR